MSNHILACVISGEKSKKRGKGEVMADSKVTVWHTDAGCRQVLPLRTMTTISEEWKLRVTSNLRGRRDPRMRTLVGSDESRFFSKLEFPRSLD